MSEITGKPVYGICDCKEKKQVLSVEQVADLIQQMAANNWQVPADYVPKTCVNGIVEQNNKDEIIFWRGTQAKYDALTDGEKAMYTPILTDEPKYNELNNSLKQHSVSIENADKAINQITTGVIPAATLKNDGTTAQITFDENGVLKIDGYSIPIIKKIWTGDSATVDISSFGIRAGDTLEIEVSHGSYGLTSRTKVVVDESTLREIGVSAGYSKTGVYYGHGIYYAELSVGSSAVSIEESVFVLSNGDSADSTDYGIPAYFTSSVKGRARIINIWLIKE